MNESLITIIQWVLFSVPQIIVVIACSMYVSKKSETDAVLMLIGSIIVVLVQGFQFIIPALSTSDILNYTEITTVYTIINILGYIGSTLFAIGLVLLIRKIIKPNPTDLLHY